jgi:TolB-like protein/DNA-binding winged helix-turn-helix (wHTH) protein/Tfp pilus assembly protein PilF
LSQSNLVRFGVFELNLRTGELRKGGVRINLPDQPFQVLKTLLERPGELVTREEMRQRLWSAETFVDFEHGLNAAVRRLRDALGDSADVPRFIETLPRRGYRFIAPVIQPPASGEASPGPEDAPGSVPLPKPPVTRARRLMRARIVGLAATAVLVLGGVLRVSPFWPLFPATGSSAVSGRFMVAVLPFTNLTGDVQQEYIGDGMTDELIAQLGAIDPSHLGVIARTSAMQFKKTTKRASQIGSDLGVSHLVEGSVRTTASRIRIGVQLIDTRNESQLWAEQYERDVANLLTLQREVAEGISRQIATTLGVIQSAAAADARRHSTIAEAYEHYLRGRHHLLSETTDGLHKALEHFQRAIDLDAGYALAYSGLADTYAFLGATGLRAMTEAYPLARASALKALAIDDRLAEAHTALAAVTVDYLWQWSEGRRHYERAIELNPNYETALRFYSFYLACMGRREEALAFAERARRVDPVSRAAQMNVATILYFARRYDDAIMEITKTLDLDPGYAPARVLLGRVHAAKGNAERAVAELERAEDLLGPRPDVLTPLAHVLARAGRPREARAMLEELRRIAKPQEPAPFRMAMIHIGLGETDRAFEWLEKAIAAREWQMVLLNVEPAFDDLRSDTRFAALVDRVGLRH